jgi:hypothetical protein
MLGAVAVKAGEVMVRPPESGFSAIDLPSRLSACGNCRRQAMMVLAR